jgi:hypothetical protein
MKATDAAKELFAALSEGMDGERRPMFGCPCLFLHGNMVFGAYANRVFFRVPRAEQAEVLAATPGARPFEPIAGKSMRDYLELDAVAANRGQLAELLARSWVQAQGLAPKVKKAAKGR